MSQYNRHSKDYTLAYNIGSLWATVYNPDGRQVYSATWFGQIVTHGRVKADKLPFNCSYNDINNAEPSDLKGTGRINHEGRHLDYWDKGTKETIQEYQTRLQSTLAVALKVETCSKDAIKDLETRLKKIEGLS